jgi:hypothetical protein
MNANATMESATAQRPAHTVNGIDVDVLMGTVNTIQADPGLGAWDTRPCSWNTNGFT